MLFAKFYTKQFDTTPVIVEECIYGGTLKDDISTGTSFEFDLPIVSGIRQFMKVEIVEAKG